jgi:NDP-sugar pyrophosphorylase family protein
MSNWRRHGGIYNLDNNNNVSVYSLVADFFTLRQSYYGTFDISGEISVSGNAKIGANLSTRNIYVLNDISTNRLFVNDKTYHYNDVDISGNLIVDSGDVNVMTNINVQGVIHLENQLYLGNSNKAYLFGTNTIGNIGINTTTPVAAFDISSSQPIAFNVGTSSLEQINSIPIQNKNNRGIVLFANTTNSQIRFFNDSSINTNIVNGTISYSNGGVLAIDVSDNVNMLSKLSVSNRDSAVVSHVMGETTVIYDISAGTYLPQIYQNSTEKTGNALSLIANDSSSNTFMNIITPNKQGVSIGGGVYPNDQTRSMGTIGWRDASANYTPSINIVSGNSLVRKKTTVGINTYAPSVDNYAFDINGPVRLKNGELTITSQSNMEVLYLAVGKTTTNNAVAIGTPYTNTGGYKQKILYTNNGGETWNENYDLSGDSIESRRINLNAAYVYDSSLSIIGGDYTYAYYTYNGYTSSNAKSAWQTIQTRFNITGIAPNYSIKSIYITSSKRVFFGIDVSGGASFLYWFTIPPDASSGFSSVGIDTSLNMPYSGIKSMDGYNNILWISVGTKIISIDTVTPSSYVDSSLNGNYNSISVLNQNSIIAAGNGIITFTTNGGASWTNISTNVPVINQIRLIDSSNAIAVGDAGIVYASQNWSAAAWRIITDNELNVSGNANLLIDPSKNLKTIGIVDSNNFYITKTGQQYSSSLLGNTSLFHVYLPNLFNNVSNYVLDISGSIRTSGDININDGGKLESNNQTFYILNTKVNKIYLGGDASNVYIGNVQDSMVAVNANLNVLRDSTLNGNLGVTGTTNLTANLNVTGNVNIQSNLDVVGNINIQSTLNVTGNTFLSNLVVNANANVSGNANIGGTLVVTGNTFLSNLVVNANANILSTLTVSGNTSIQSNLIVESDAIMKTDMYVNGRIRSTIIESNSGTIQAGPSTGGTNTYDIYIGGSDITDISSRSIKIGNFNNDPFTKNNIYLGGVYDEVFLYGNITQVKNSKIGQILYMNSAYLDSAGSGLHFGDNNNPDSGYFVISSDKSGYVFKSTQNANILKLDLSNSVIPSSQSTGLMSIYKAPSGTDSSYIVYTSEIDPSNIILSSTTYPQNIYANITLGNTIISGTLLVTGNTFMSNLVVNDNANIGGTLSVTGNTFLSNLVVNANANISGNANIGGSLVVTGNTFLSNLVVNANANIFGNANIEGTLVVTGNTFLSNLVVNANANISGNANIEGTLTVTGNTFLSNLVVNANANISGNANVGGTLVVTGNTFLSNLVVNANANISGNANVGGTLVVTGNTFLSNLVVNANANIFGNANIGGTLVVTGNTFLSNLVVNANANIFGNANIGGTLTVTGNTFLSNLVVNANANIFGNANVGGSLVVTGNTFLSNLVVNANADIFGNANIGGTLTVTGNTFLSNLVVNANANIFGNANIGGTLVVTGNTFLSNLVVNANANIFGNANIGGTLVVTGNTFLSNLVVNANANIFGNANIGGTLIVTGNTFLSNLVVNANANIFGNANIGGTLVVTGNTFLSNLVVNANANIFGNANIGGTLVVTGNTFLSNLVVNANANIFGNANIGGTLTVTGNTFLSNLVVNANANIFGNANIGGTLVVTGNTVLSNLVVNANANIFGNANIGGTLVVTGNTFLSNLVVNANANIFGNANIGGSLVVTGNTVLSNLVVNANANIFGNANIGGTLVVTGNTVLSNLVVNANANIFGNANIGGTLVVTGNTFLSNLVVNANANIFGNANIGGTLVVTGNTFLSNLVVNANANIFGNANIGGTLVVTGNTFLSNLVVNANANIFGNANVGGTLVVTGNTFLSNLVVNANANIFGNANIGGTLVVTGNTFLSNLVVRANANIFGNANIGGTLFVTGNTFLSNLSVRANANISGNANIGGTLTVGTGLSTNDYELLVNGSIVAVSYNATSDRRLKSNIQFLSNQSKSILNIVPVTFNWKVDGRRDIGFIAQNIYQTYPEIRPNIRMDPSSNIDEPTDLCGNPVYYTMDYGRMTPFLWQGMREIIQRLEVLEMENIDLKSRISRLESNNK